MRHQRATSKLGRTSKHKEALIANLTIGLITHNRITTTLAKAKVVRPFAEKLVTLGKSGTLHHRRVAASKIGDKNAVRKLFADIAPRFKNRQGGYTRIVKLGFRKTDAADMALIEWVEASTDATPAAPAVAATPATPAPGPEAKS